MDDFKELADRITLHVEWFEEFLPKVNFQYKVGETFIRIDRGTLEFQSKGQWLPINKSASLLLKMDILEAAKDILAVAQKEKQLFIGKMEAVVQEFSKFKSEVTV